MHPLRAIARRQGEMPPVAARNPVASMEAFAGMLQRYPLTISARVGSMTPRLSFIS
jgi:hypothetical protein